MKFMIKSGMAALAICAVIAFSQSADAKMDKVCTEAWKAAKLAGTIAKSTTLKSYAAEKCGPAENASTTAPAATAPTTPGAPATNSANNGSFMSDCSAKWKSMKAAKSVPEGLAWKDFVKAGCNAPAANTGASATAPPSGGASSVAMPSTNATTAPVALTDKNGKPLSANQIAARKRIKACGAQWRSEKAAGRLPADAKWPQYWGACSAKLKAAGQ